MPTYGSNDASHSVSTNAWSVSPPGYAAVAAAGCSASAKTSASWGSSQSTVSTVEIAVPVGGAVAPAVAVVPSGRLRHWPTSSSSTDCWHATSTSADATSSAAVRAMRSHYRPPAGTSEVP